MLCGGKLPPVAMVLGAFACLGAAPAARAEDQATRRSLEWQSTSDNPEFIPAPQEEPPTSWWLGVAYRQTVLPAFLLDIALDGAETIYSPGLGLEVTRIRRKFDLTAQLSWQGFSDTQVLRRDNESIETTEFSDIDLWGIFAGASLLANVPVHRRIVFQYGGDFALGVLGGSIHRTEAYLDEDGDWQRCEGPEQPASGGFCEAPAVGAESEDGGHYGVRARRWAEGGSVPNLWFRVAPRVAMKFYPARRVMLRVDTGFDFFSGFFTGVGASYRLL